MEKKMMMANFIQQWLVHEGWTYSWGDGMFLGGY